MKPVTEKKDLKNKQVEEIKERYALEMRANDPNLSDEEKEKIRLENIRHYEEFTKKLKKRETLFNLGHFHPSKLTNEEKELLSSPPSPTLERRKKI